MDEKQQQAMINRLMASNAELEDEITRLSEQLLEQQDLLYWLEDGNIEHAKKNWYFAIHMEGLEHKQEG